MARATRVDPVSADHAVTRRASFPRVRRAAAGRTGKHHGRRLQPIATACRNRVSHARRRALVSRPPHVSRVNRRLPARHARRGQRVSQGWRANPAVSHHAASGGRQRPPPSRRPAPTLRHRRPRPCWPRPSLGKPAKSPATTPVDGGVAVAAVSAEKGWKTRLSCTTARSPRKMLSAALPPTASSPLHRSALHR